MQLAAHTQFTGLDISAMARGVQFEHVPALELLPGAGWHVDVVEVSSAQLVDAWLTTTEAEGRLTTRGPRKGIRN